MLPECIVFITFHLLESQIISGLFFNMILDWIQPKFKETCAQVFEYESSYTHPHDIKAL